jgi:hypothetical protein
MMFRAPDQERGRLFWMRCDMSLLVSLPLLNDAQVARGVVNAN